MLRKFSLIAAVTDNLGIGLKNALPWKKFPNDMNWFKKKTLNQTVIMGRRTWESMSCRPLPKRHNMVISSRALELAKSGEVPNNVSFFSSLDQALQEVKTEQVYVIGGSQLYQEAMKHKDCASILLTHAKVKVPVDTYFPKIKQSEFKLNEVLQSGVDKVTIDDDNISEVSYEMLEYIPRDLTLKARRSEMYTRYAGEEGYLQALKLIMEEGEVRRDRTGVGTKALFGLNFRYDLLNQNYPLLTTKKMFTRGIFEELLWFLRGETDVSILREKKVHIWDGNSTREFLDSRGLDYPEWDIGPAYGAQFRHAGAEYVNATTDYTGQGVDQLQNVIDILRNDPHSRRAIINLWNVRDLEKMALPPCLFMYQFWVSEDKYLNLSLYQRSGDMGLGVPFNIASASLMMNIVGKLTGLIPKELVHTIGDAHIYMDHIEPLQKQVAREPRPFPKLQVVDRGQTKVEDFDVSDFIVEGYHPYPGIKMKMAV